MTARFDIVCFGLAEWDSPLPTNQRHLARRFSRTGRVLFVDTVGTRQPRWTPADIARVARRLLRRGQGPREVEPSIWRLSPLAPAPGLKGAGARWLGRAFCRSVAQGLGRLGWRRPVGWFFNPRASIILRPEAQAAFAALGAGAEFSLVVYHAVDDLACVPGAAAEEITEAESFLAKRADLTLASAPALYERLSALAPGKTHHLPNVADFEHFHRAACEGLALPPRQEAIARPRIVFAGNLTPSKIDFSLLRQMLEARPTWQWVFIGPAWEGAGAEELGRLRRLGNAHFLGLVPYDDLPLYLAGADALIIPYRLGSSTASVCPLKFFEFLATGKPTVATPLPALRPYGGVVALAEGAEAFLGELDRALSADDPLRRKARLSLARLHTWDRRMEEINALLQERLAARGEADG